jgi:virginiamycin A acetyltransferase
MVSSFSKEDLRDLQFCVLSKFIVRLHPYRRLRRFLTSHLRKHEPDAFTSGTIRQILLNYYGVYVGAYSYGSCLSFGKWPENITIGRYVSVGPGVEAYRRNHPMERVSMHPYFYNSALGALDRDNIQHRPLSIGHDAWIGANAILTPSCEKIGLGAVVGAGSVVTKSVPDFAIVAGNPAKLIRYRFCDRVQQEIVDSEWWRNSKHDCLNEIQRFSAPAEHVLSPKQSSSLSTVSE